MDSHIHEWEDVVWNGLRSHQCTICGKVVWSCSGRRQIDVWSCSGRRLVDEEPYLKRIAELEAELVGLKARRCETCERYGSVVWGCECDVEAQIVRLRGDDELTTHAPDGFCSEWRAVRDISVARAIRYMRVIDRPGRM